MSALGHKQPVVQCGIIAFERLVSGANRPLSGSSELDQIYLAVSVR